MGLSFEAIEGGAGENEFGLHLYVAGRDAAGAVHYLSLQREAESARSTTDWGVHLEFDGHINGTYDCVSQCCFNATQLSVVLSKPLGPLKRGDGIRVALAFDEALMQCLRDALPRIFRDRQGVLRVA